ncbi:hypothetical protein NBO_6g0059, partial [Nosema bombycis CQ1]
MDLINKINEDCKNGGNMLSDLFTQYVEKFAPLNVINSGCVEEDEKKYFYFLLQEQSDLVQGLKLDAESICNTMDNLSEEVNLKEFSENIDIFLEINSEILEKWRQSFPKENKSLVGDFEGTGSKYKTLLSKNYKELTLEHDLEPIKMARGIEYFEAVSELSEKMIFHFKTFDLTYRIKKMLDFKEVRHESFSKLQHYTRMLISSFELFDLESKNSIQHHFKILCNLDTFLYKEMIRCSIDLSVFCPEFMKNVIENNEFI